MILDRENELENQALGAALNEGEQQTGREAEREDELSLKDEILANVKAVGERPRDEQGRFIKPQEQAQQKPEGAANEQQPSEKQQPAQQGKEGAQQPKPEAAVQPPTSWSAEAKAEFAKLPGAVKDAISKREAEVHRGFTAQDEDRNTGKQLREIASPYMPIIAAEGGTVATAFQTLLNSAYVLRQGSQEQKTALVKDLINRYNIPLEGITASPPNSSGNPQPQQLPGMSREEVAQIARETQQGAHIEATITAFASDPANVHFQTVRPQMSALLIAGAATSLKDAYDQACRAHPQISSSLAAAEAAKAEEQRQAGIRQKAAAAKHAGGSVTGSPGASTPPPKVNEPDRNLRDEIAYNMATLTQQRI